MRRPLRLLSYNVRYATLDTGRLAWAERRDAVASTVRFHRPDAVAVQECWLGQLDDLRERLPAYDWVAHPDDNGEHTPVGYRPDRLDLRDSGAVTLHPEGERNVPGWDAAAPRQATHATLADRETGTGFTLFSVHLDHAGERAREAGAALLREELPDGPVAVLGDLNCAPGDPPYRTFDADLVDAREAADHVHGPRETYVGFGGEGGGEDDDPEPARLDYAFLRGFDVEAYGVAADVDADWSHPSDHLPVVVDATPRDGQ